MLTPDEVQALDWLQHNTTKDAIVQVEPSVRNSYTWAYIPAFAERRMAGGLPISMVPLDRYQAASARVKDVYTAADARTIYDRARALRIDYLVVGTPEREAYKTFEPTLNDHPLFFQPVLQNSALSIYHLAR
jgi:uncharacterized membrane protein